MFNILELARRNRLSGLFNPLEDQFSGYQLPSQYDNQDMPNLSNEMQGQFQSLLKQFPQRKPVGNWRKLGSVIAGLGSENPMETADKFANYHFYNQLKDYETKLPFFQQAANTERNFNQQVMNQWMQDRRQDELERRNLATEQFNRTKLESTEEIARRRLNIQERRAAVYEFKARNPNYKFVHDTTTGKIFAVNPQNPTEKIDTNLSHGELSDLDKANLQLRNTIAGIEKRGDEAIEAINARGVQTRQNIAARGTSTGVTRPESETQKNQRYTNNALKLAAERPDLEKFMKFEGTGTSRKFVGLKSATGGVFGIGTTGLSETDRKLINERIFGTPSNVATGVEFEDPKLREQATKILQDNKKPVTPANIEYVIKQLKGGK